MSFFYHVVSILTYVEREYLQGRPFKNFQQFYLAISRMLTNYKISFICKANGCLEIEHDEVNNITFELELQNLGTLCELRAKDIHLYNPKRTVKGVHSVQYYDAENNYCPV